MSATAHNGCEFRSLLLSTAHRLPMEQRQPPPTARHHGHDIPAVLADYNKFCGGVDTANRWAALGTLYRKSYRPHMTFLEHWISVSIANAWILRCDNKELHPMTLSEFTLDLAEDLISSFNGRQRAVGQPISIAVAHDPAMHVLVHPPESNGERNPRRRCKICSQLTVCICSCGTVICNTERHCMKIHAPRDDVKDDDDDADA
jgi:hypothetical protein